MLRAAFANLLPCCLALVLGGGGLYAATDGFRALTEESARRLHVAQQQPRLPGIELEDMNKRALRIGQEVTPPQEITLVEFIYTTCPTICQTAGSDFARLRSALKSAELGERVRLLSVSFDPSRDDPEQMRTYAGHHGADGAVWTVARPSVEKLPLMIASFGLRIIPDGWGGYQHNTAIHLVDRRGRLTGVFDTDDFDGVLEAVKGAL